METELKLLLDPADAASLRRHPLLRQHAVAKPHVQQLASIYFDTPDFHFRRHDAALRVRRVQRQWIQTLKSGAQAAAGLHRREEWESGVRGPQPDLAALADLIGRGTDLAAAFTAALTAAPLAERLSPVFTTVFRRTAWLLRLEPGCEVELALDQGEIRCDAGSAAISEIELELKSGDAAALFDFALELQSTLPLRIGDVSKSARGYALCAPQPLLAAKAARVELSPAFTVEQGWQRIVGNCLLQIQGNATGVAEGGDPDSLHQMRVGLRRLRSAFGLFAAVAPCPAALQTELEWLGAALGPARDWEVCASGTLAAVADAYPGQPELARLQQAARAVARQRRQAAAAAVASVRFARLLLSLGGWIQGARWRAPFAASQRAALQAPLVRFAAQALALRRRKLKQRGKRLKEATPPARHRMRVAAKKVRYATEFFESLYPARRVRPAVAALTALQDALGRLNDAAVAGKLLQRFATGGPELAHGAGFVRGYLAARSERDARRLGKLWKRLAPRQLAGAARRA